MTSHWSVIGVSPAHWTLVIWSLSAFPSGMVDTIWSGQTIPALYSVALSRLSSVTHLMLSLVTAGLPVLTRFCPYTPSTYIWAYFPKSVLALALWAHEHSSWSWIDGSGSVLMQADSFHRSWQHRFVAGISISIRAEQRGITRETRESSKRSRRPKFVNSSFLFPEMRGHSVVSTCWEVLFSFCLACDSYIITWYSEYDVIGRHVSSTWLGLVLWCVNKHNRQSRRLWKNRR